MMTKIDLKGSRATILGGGVSGVSLAKLALSLGAEVFVSDRSSLRREAAEELRASGIVFEEGGHTSRALECDHVILSSGFPPSAPILRDFEREGIQFVSELDLAIPLLGNDVDCPVIIGVTGSNGKTTTTSLIGHLLESMGKKTAVIGNIGSPIASACGRECDYAVIELSSFQLHWAHAIELDCVVLTNIAPDHIDWHGSFERYAADKRKIFSFLKEGAPGIAQSADLPFVGPTRGKILSLSKDASDDPDIFIDLAQKDAKMDGEILFRSDESTMIGAHNMENIGMACAALKMLGSSAADLRRGLGTFVAPPHRCAAVVEADGIRYVDDSKGTNIAATVTALQSIDGKKVIILGGRGKGEDYSELVEPLTRYARWAVLIGEEAQAIARALDDGGYRSFSIVDSMEPAVREARSRAENGDCVLLSPACTSWDQYRNYGERGDHFAELARKIVGERP